MGSNEQVFLGLWIALFSISDTAYAHVESSVLPNIDIFWVFAIIGALNAMSGGLDWLAKVIPGKTDDKVINVIKNILSGLQKLIDFFTARGRR